MRGHEGYGLVALTVEELEAAGQTLVPMPTDDDPFHAEVVGTKSKATKRELAKTARWVVPPPGQPAEP